MFILSLGWFVLFLVLSLLQFETSHNRSFDLALYARSLWGIAHGYPVNPLRDQHVLALHGHWILYPLAPLARIFSSVTILLVTQAAALAVGAVVTYFIAARRLESRPAALICMCIYLLLPLNLNAVLYEAHVKTFAMPFLLAGLDRLDARGPKDILSWVLLVVALACREEIALQIAALGVVWLFFARNRSVGLILIPLGVGIFMFYFFGVRQWVGSDGAAESVHFGHLATGSVLSQLISWRNMMYMLFLFGSFAALPLIGLRYVVPVMVVAGMNMLSALEGTISPASHYSFLCAPFLILATIEALVIIRRWRPRALAGASLAVLAAMVVSYILVGHGPGGRGFDPDRFLFDGETQVLNFCLHQVPPDVPVMAPPHVVAQFAERRLVDYRISSPEMVEQLSFVLLEMDPISWVAHSEAYMEYIDRRRRQAVQLVRYHGFGIRAQCGPYVLLQRIRPAGLAPAATMGERFHHPADELQGVNNGR